MTISIIFLYENLFQSIPFSESSKAIWQKILFYFIFLLLIFLLAVKMSFLTIINIIVFEYNIFKYIGMCLLVLLFIH